MSALPPRTTRIPNELLDVMMSDGVKMSDAELRVSLAIYRKTWGWRKDRDKISISQLEALTGLSRQGVIDGIEAAMKRGLIAREACGNSFEYYPIVNSVDQSSQETSQDSRPISVNSVDHSLVNSVDTQKKEVKEKRNHHHAPTPTPQPPGGGERKSTRPPRPEPERPNRTETFIFLADDPDGPKLGDVGTLNRCADLPLAGVKAEWERVKAAGKGGGWLAKVILDPSWRPPVSKTPLLDDLAARIRAAQLTAQTHPDPAQRSEASQLAYALTLKRARIMDGAP